MYGDNQNSYGWAGDSQAFMAWMGIVKTAMAVAGDRHNLLLCHLIPTLTLSYYLDTSHKVVLIIPNPSIAVLTIPVHRGLTCHPWN